MSESFGHKRPSKAVAAAAVGTKGDTPNEQGNIPPSPT